MPDSARPIYCLLISLLLFTIHTDAVGADGIQIVVFERQAQDTWLVREYIDNALVGAMSTVTGEGAILPAPSVKVTEGAENAEISLLAAESQPLIVFVSDHVTPLEEHIASAGQAHEAAELDLERRRQVLGGLFAVPFWPFLAASEVPLQGITLERTVQVEHWRETMFPAAVYGSAGNVPDWDFVRLEGQAVVLHPGESTGIGKGISLDYIINGPVSDFAVRLSGHADVTALYCDGGKDWELKGGQVELVSHPDFIGLLETGRETGREQSGYSIQMIGDGDGELGRYLIALSKGVESVEMRWSATPGLPEGSEGVGISLTLAIVMCWILFGLAVVAGNWLFRFSTASILSLLGTAMAIYPVYLGISFLLAGLWGLGFIPGAVLSARILSAEGCRMKASGVVLASGFLAAIVSLIMWT